MSKSTSDGDVKPKRNKPSDSVGNRMDKTINGLESNVINKRQKAKVLRDHSRDRSGKQGK